jgi:hypothetical protein
MDAAVARYVSPHRRFSVSRSISGSNDGVLFPHAAVEKKAAGGQEESTNHTIPSAQHLATRRFICNSQFLLQV